MNNLLIYQMIPKCATHTMYRYFSKIPEQPKSIFLHQEKTYTSDNISSPDKYSFLFSYFLCRTADNMAYLKTIDSETLTKADYSITYSSYGIHKGYNRKCEYVTIIREPMDRAQSFYYWIKTKFPEEHSLRKLAEKLTFTEFHKNLVPNNFMTLMISGMWYECLYNDKNALQKAIENIKNSYAIIATLEKYNAFIAGLEKMTGWSHQGDIEKQHVNSTRKRIESLTENEINIIKNHDPLDYDLYAYLKDRGGIIFR